MTKKESDEPMDLSGAHPIDPGAVVSMCNWLQINDVRVIKPALCSLVDILSRTDKATDRVIDCGILRLLVPLLQHKKIKIVENSAWIISYITAGTEQQIQAVIDSDVIQYLTHIMQKGNFKSQKAAVWAITNIILAGTMNQIRVMVDKFKILGPYLDLMDTKDERTTKMILNGLTRILCNAQHFGGLDHLTLMVEQLGCLDKLEALQTHQDVVIYKMSYDIIDKYFS
ncbi:importin subunit alpha-like [Drosophila willistoni]|uniref:importin subunit alpha-like n=1 Tax=Drosophila willistoni TaxID=7260 RepID=UPI001F080BA5|nr:importin subunit alpha-like [Drosophila willistoni]